MVCHLRNLVLDRVLLTLKLVLVDFVTHSAQLTRAGGYEWLFDDVMLNSSTGLACLPLSLLLRHGDWGVQLLGQVLVILNLLWNFFSI